MRGNYDRREKARREFKVFELHRHRVPAPAPLLLDEAGEALGSPGIVTRFVEGELQLEKFSDPPGCDRFHTFVENAKNTGDVQV